MKNTITVRYTMIVLIIVSLSFSYLEHESKREILFDIDLDVKGWFDGSGSLSLDVNNYQEIEKIFVEGYVFPVRKMDSLSIGNLRDDESNKFSLSEYIDKIISIQLDNSFSKEGGKITIFVHTLGDGLREEILYIHKNKNEYKSYLDSIHPSREIKDLKIKLREDKVESYSIGLKNK